MILKILIFRGMWYMFNIADFFVLIIIIISVFNAWNKGIIKTIFNLFSGLLSIVAAKILYPVVTGIIRNTIIFDNIKAAILEKIKNADIVNIQEEFISNLQIPDFFKLSLLENNKPEVYKYFNVNSFQDYIASYAANFLISILSVFIIIIVTFIIIRIIGKTLDFLSEAPVLNFLNHAAGAALGLGVALIIIWIAFIFLTLFFTKPEFRWIYEAIQNSLIANWFYSNNIILNAIVNLVG